MIFLVIILFSTPIRYIPYLLLFEILLLEINNSELENAISPDERRDRFWLEIVILVQFTKKTWPVPSGTVLSVVFCQKINNFPLIVLFVTSDWPLSSNIHSSIWIPLFIKILSRILLFRDPKREIPDSLLFEMKLLEII